MGRVWRIGFLALAFLVACNSNKQAPELVEGPSVELSAIDSLLWQQPDSALTCLLPYFDTCKDTKFSISTATAYDRHYANLLLSELLYKNDYTQTNRPALWQAVAYFDSLVQRAPPLQRGLGGLKNSQSPTQHDIIAFLDARAHYINGVGYYEHDSVVEACKEYMKTLEVMEEHFEEEELMGKKAKFMALTYTHLAGLYSNYYLHEQTIYFGWFSLKYYQQYDATPWHVAWTLCDMGSQYEMKGIVDSAVYYYKKGVETLPNTNSLIYRDLTSRLAFLFYHQEGCDMSLNQLKSLLAQAESPKEHSSRCLTIGEVYFQEKEFDSAWLYLNEVYYGVASSESKRQAAEWLVEICNATGKTDEVLEYANFLVPFANINENQSHIKSQLLAFCQEYEKDRIENRHRERLWKNTKYGCVILVALSALTAVFAFLHINQRKRHKHLIIQKEAAEKRMEAENYSHRIQQAAMAGRLKRSNDALRLQKEEKEELLKELQTQRKQKEWSQLDDFMNEDICMEILQLLQGKDIKREAKRNDYPELHLNASQLLRLETAVEKCFEGFGKTLTDLFPRISSDEIHQCHLYLLNLQDVQIAHLLSCDYSTVKKRSAKLKKAFGTEKELLLFIRGFIV